MGSIHTKMLSKAVRESAFNACQSDTPREGANSHLRPGRQKLSVRHWTIPHIPETETETLEK